VLDQEEEEPFISLLDDKVQWDKPFFILDS